MTQNEINSTAVRNLQRYLRRLSYNNESIRPVPIDGIFDTETEERIRFEVN